MLGHPATGPTRSAESIKHLISSTRLPGPWYFEAGDAAIADPPDVRAKATEKRESMFFEPGEISRSCSRGRIRSGNFCSGASRLIGKDRVGPEYRSSSQALRLLKEAAITSPNSPSDEATGNCNLLYTLSRASFRHGIEGSAIRYSRDRPTDACYRG